jgi:hypothetical protein
LSGSAQAAKLVHKEAGLAGFGSQLSRFWQSGAVNFHARATPKNWFVGEAKNESPLQIRFSEITNLGQKIAKKNFFIPETLKSLEFSCEKHAISNRWGWNQQPPASHVTPLITPLHTHLCLS